MDLCPLIKSSEFIMNPLDFGMRMHRLVKDFIFPQHPFEFIEAAVAGSRRV